MREILFRGKRADNGEWVYGSFVPDALEGSNDLVSWGFIRRYNRGIGKMETIEVGRETVGQYTGLKDKNDVKIFEGDIIEIESDGQKTRREIVFSQASFQFHRSGGLAPMRYNLKYSNTFDGLVIGNIHDNPELMGEKK